MCKPRQKHPFVELEHNTMPEKSIGCDDVVFSPAELKNDPKSRQKLEIRIGEVWLHVRIFEDVIHFETMKGDFLGLIKSKA